MSTFQRIEIGMYVLLARAWLVTQVTSRLHVIPSQQCPGTRPARRATGGASHTGPRAPGAESRQAWPLRWSTSGPGARHGRTGTTRCPVSSRCEATEGETWDKCRLSVTLDGYPGWELPVCYDWHRGNTHLTSLPLVSGVFDVTSTGQRSSPWSCTSQWKSR